MGGGVPTMSGLTSSKVGDAEVCITAPPFVEDPQEQDARDGSKQQQNNGHAAVTVSGKSQLPMPSPDPIHHVFNGPISTLIYFSTK